MMTHFAKNGECKLMKRCDWPLTGMRVVDTIVSDFGIFLATGKAFRIEKLASGISKSDLGIDAGLLE
jgi:acyl CoA:acetate/3-ketoacid CoA transferase beta subunit